MPQPQFSSIDPVPVRTLPLIKQKQDCSCSRPLARCSRSDLTP
jgi:hypothetical protein